MPVLDTPVSTVCFLSSLVAASEQVKLASPPSRVTLDKLLHVSEPQYLPPPKCPLIPSSHLDGKNYETIKTQTSLVHIPVPSGDVREFKFTGCLAHRTCEPTRGPQKPCLPPDFKCWPALVTRAAPTEAKEL